MALRIPLCLCYGVCGLEELIAKLGFYLIDVEFDLLLLLHGDNE